MAVIKVHESRNIPNMPYIMFFLGQEGNSRSVDVVAIIHDEQLDPSWAWTVWILQATADEIDDVCSDLERRNPVYDTEGFSTTCGSIGETLEELKNSGFCDFPAMEQDILAFFA